MRLFCCEVAANFNANGGFVNVRRNCARDYSFAAVVADLVAGKHAVKVAP